MQTFGTILHILVCVFMIFVILLQPGKDAGMGAALGGGAATSAFGGRGAVTFLSKITAFCAALFFITSLGLSFADMKSGVAARRAQSGAVTPGAAAAADAGMVVEPTIEVPAGSAVAPASGEGAVEAAAGDAGAVAPVPPAE